MNTIKKDDIQKFFDSEITKIEGLQVTSEKETYKISLKNARPSKLAIYKKHLNIIEQNLSQKETVLKSIQLRKEYLRVPLSYKVVKLEDIIFEITEYIEGSPIILCEKYLREFALYLKKLHNELPFKTLGPSLKDPANEIKNLITKVENRIYILKDGHKDYCREILNSLKEMERYIVTNTEKHIVCGDLFLGNIIRDLENEVVIIDWDWVGMGDPYRDLADFICSNLITNTDVNYLTETDLNKLINNYAINIDLVNIFLSNYFENLTVLDKEKLKTFMEYYCLSYAYFEQEDTINLREFAKYKFINLKISYFS